MIQGTSSGAGKTTIATALCRIFSDDGYNVVPFKSQNMSNFSYPFNGLEISRAQAIQAIAARCDIESDLNPILLKPLGNSTSLVYLDGKKYKKMNTREYYDTFVNSKGLDTAISSLKRLQKNHDLIILEGAGSPAEINLYDIANMKMAHAAEASVLLVTDIDRGGSFASLVGTLQLLKKSDQDILKGFIFNKFRGDLEILKPGFRKLKQITHRPVLGTIPMLKFNLPSEDSLDGKPSKVTWNASSMKTIDKEITSLAKLTKSFLDMRQIRKMIK